MLVHWIWLATRPHVSDRVKLALVERFRDAEDVYYASQEELSQMEGLTQEAVAGLLDKKLSEAHQILARCSDKKLQVLTWIDGAYPSRLRNIPDPPMVLYYKGTLPLFDEVPVIGAVGTRKASTYGCTVARRMGYQIAACGAIVVSGIAAGIDAAAMKGALEAGGTVVGVLGHGADVIYPAGNRGLFADVERCGCLLSEFPPQTKPSKWTFPKRNRIISGLSNGVLVAEAPARSGALITARQAAEQGRDVFVVPGNIDSPTCIGSNALLRDGAVAVSSGWDIVSEYEAAYPGRVCHRDGAPEPERTMLKVAQEPVRLEPEQPQNRRPDKKEIDNGASAPYIDGEKILSSLTQEERGIAEYLRQGPCLTDDVLAHCGGTPGKVLAALTMLEVKGVIRRLPGNLVALK